MHEHNIILYGGSKEVYTSVVYAIKWREVMLLRTDDYHLIKRIREGRDREFISTSQRAAIAYELAV